MQLKRCGVVPIGYISHAKASRPGKTTGPACFCCVPCNLVMPYVLPKVRTTSRPQWYFVSCLTPPMASPAPGSKAYAPASLDAWPAFPPVQDIAPHTQRHKTKSRAAHFKSGPASAKGMAQAKTTSAMAKAFYVGPVRGCVRPLALRF